MLGGSVSLGALDHALGELGAKLRITRVDYNLGEGSFWDVLYRWSPDAVREGIGLSVAEALSALLTKYLDCVIAADQQELESFFGHFVSRARIKEALNALLAARELRIHSCRQPLPSSANTAKSASRQGSRAHTLKQGLAGVPRIRDWVSSFDFLTLSLESCTGTGAGGKRLQCGVGIPPPSPLRVGMASSMTVSLNNRVSELSIVRRTDRAVHSKGSFRAAFLNVDADQVRTLRRQRLRQSRDEIFRAIYLPLPAYRSLAQSLPYRFRNFNAGNVGADVGEMPKSP